MPVQTQRGGRGTAPKHLNSHCYEGARGHHHAPDAEFPGKTQRCLCIRPDGPRDLCVLARKYSYKTGIRYLGLLARIESLF
jgi:hypothetical protein